MAHETHDRKVSRQRAGLRVQGNTSSEIARPEPPGLRMAPPAAAEMEMDWRVAARDSSVEASPSQPSK